MPTNAENNRRIAKNTLMLYVRMILTMAISLYTSRVVLATLGVDDFGIYNVVGGVVAMFAFINNAMATSTQRYLSFEIAGNNPVALQRTFNAALVLHIGIALSVVLLAETLGLWYLNEKMIIPPDRMVAARWVYHFAVASFAVTIIQVPYTAAIFAHERMNLFAYISLLDVVLKLVIVFLLTQERFDALKLYALLMFIVTLLVALVYRHYVKRSYQESRFKWTLDIPLYKTLISYSGWNLFGSMAGVFMGQGINLLLNLFFGTAINAARGIAFQVNNAVNGFVLNIQAAMNPQIVKSYAVDDRGYMHQLIIRSSKYSFFLLFFLEWPLLLEADLVLQVWLKEVPPYAVLFTRLVLVNTLIDCVSGSLMTATQATGRIKTYQAVVGSLLMANLPIAYLFLKAGYPPQSAFYVGICISLIAFVFRLSFVSPMIQLRKRTYLLNVMGRLVPLVIITSIPTILIRLYLPDGWLRFLLIGFSSVLLAGASIYLTGLTKQEKDFLHTQLNKFIPNKRPKPQ